jgi:hypothetical protein
MEGLVQLVGELREALQIAGEPMQITDRDPQMDSEGDCIEHPLLAADLLRKRHGLIGGSEPILQVSWVPPQPKPAS